MIMPGMNWQTQYCPRTDINNKCKQAYTNFIAGILVSLIYAQNYNEKLVISK